MACSKVHNICNLLKSYLSNSLSLSLTAVRSGVLMQTEGRVCYKVLNYPPFLLLLPLGQRSSVTSESISDAA